MRHREPLNESERPKVEEKCPECACGNSIYKVCFKRNIETGTIHIFCCECQIETVDDCKVKSTKICLCDCINRAGHNNFQLINNKAYTLEEARIKAAELQNQGDNVCGICVSALYHNAL